MLCARLSRVIEQLILTGCCMNVFFCLGIAESEKMFLRWEGEVLCLSVNVGTMLSCVKS